MWSGALAILVSLGTVCAELEPIVKSKLGFHQGIWTESEGGHQVANFLGIPYAKPPIIKRRFQVNKFFRSDLISPRFDELRVLIRVTLSQTDPWNCYQLLPSQGQTCFSQIKPWLTPKPSSGVTRIPDALQFGMWGRWYCGEK